jgi:hypothetical protein
MYCYPIPHGPNQTGATDDKSGGCKDTKVINDKDNCGAAAMEHLFEHRTYRVQKNIVDMGIFTASVFLSTEVGEFAKKYQMWHKQMAEQNASASRPVSMITKGSARIHLTQMRKRLR